MTKKTTFDYTLEDGFTTHFEYKGMMYVATRYSLYRLEGLTLQRVEVAK